MKNLRNAGLMFLAIIALHSCNTASLKSLKMENADDSASYMVGVYYGQSLKNQDGGHLNSALIAQGVEKSLKGDTSISIQAAGMYLNTYFQKRREEAGKKNIEIGQKYLADNKSKAGVIETASGLQYKVIQEGTGKTPTLSDNVKCNYTGKKIDGTKFDSSYDRGEPAEFPVTGVIPGWTEALQLMKEGGKYELYIPSELAYGAQGNQGIEPNSTLIFELELLEVKAGQNPNEQGIH